MHVPCSGEGVQMVAFALLFCKNLRAINA